MMACPDIIRGSFYEFLPFFFSVVLFFAYLQKLSKKVQKMTKKKEGSKS